MVGDDAGDDGFGNQLSIHGGPATHFAEVVAPAQDFHFDAQLIARDYRSAKLGVFDTGKVNQLFSRRLVTIEEDGSDLSHGLNHQHPRHTGAPGKCPWKKCSLIVTFLMPTMRLGSSSVMRSTRRKGYRWGRIFMMSVIPYTSCFSAFAVTIGSGTVTSASNFTSGPA